MCKLEFCWRKAVLFFLTIFLSLTYGINSYGDVPPSILEEDIKNGIQKLFNVPKESIIITTITNGNFPLQGQMVTVAKAMNMETQDIYTIGFDRQKQIVDLTLLEKTETELHQKHYGNIETDLYERLQQMQDLETTDVLIWLKGDDNTPILSFAREEIEAKGQQKIQEEYTVAWESRQKSISNITMPFVEFLKREHQTGQAISEVPVVSARLSKMAINNIANLPFIEKIYMHRGFQSALNQSSNAINTLYGITGNGYVGIVEWEPVATWNPNLNVTIAGWNYRDCYGSSSSLPYHATYVAGIINSIDYNNTGHLGIANGSSIVSAPFCGKTGTDIDILSAATNDVINPNTYNARE